MDGFEQLTMNWRSALIGLTMACSAVALIYLVRRGIERAAITWLTVFVIAANIAAIPMLITSGEELKRRNGLGGLARDLRLMHEI